MVDFTTMRRPTVKELKTRYKQTPRQTVLRDSKTVKSILFT